MKILLAPLLATANVQAATCPLAYRPLYQKQILEVAVVFGYKDARPARFVGDRYEALWLEEKLLRPCLDKKQGLCGFERQEDGELFERKRPRPGAARTDAVDRLRVRLVSSSAGPDDVENRKNPWQSERSRHAEDVFLGALKEAAVIFYDGHSRDGGGPDFAPPWLTENGSLHVDYARYQHEMPGLKNLTAALQKEANSSPTRLLGLFSCASSRHFEARLKKAAPRLGLLVSPRLLYYQDALEALAAALEGLFSEQCEEDFLAGLAQAAPNAGFQIKNYFPLRNQ